MDENSIDGHINDGIVALRQNDDNIEEEPLIRNPNVLVNNELRKLSDKMAELKNSLHTLKNVKLLSETLLKKK